MTKLNNKRKSIILLSGGLDSLVCLGLCRDKYNVELALTFDYGQKARKNEIDSAKKLCKYYGVKNHEIIKLDWLKSITTCALVSDVPLPKGVNNNPTANQVWVPNRNGLFLNIAAAFADSKGYTHIIIGANNEEAETFPDNTKEFINNVNSEFKYSTMHTPEVISPLINYNKNDIVKLALDNAMPLDLVYSCYDTKKYHCGECESCTRLKKALEANGDRYYKDKIFKN